MKAIPPALQERLNSGVTTLCRCWVLTRRDGVVQGFTDHDEDVPLGDVLCRADAALSGSEISARLGLAVDGAEISGALADESLAESDLAAGRYDAAQVDTYIVDWSEPSLNVLMTRATLGEVRREGRAFTAELRGLADRLAQESGRLYTAACAADLGDARCGVDLDHPLYKASGAVVALVGTSAFAAAGLDDFPDGWFSAGALVWTSGANTGLAAEIKRHRTGEAEVVLELWQAAPEPPAPGDTFTVTAGCDKRFPTCRDRFANTINFRGFPHIPGNDFVMRYAIDGEPGHDGKSMQEQ
ncbi:MAG: DUF2163 domain-containing protein [Pseudorhodoplanes sp.]|nr:hypothetical protein [Pseudorhodoplanes sp.]MBW7949864.1 DUF2163 domain-containing protein [Pseudorhodoplanes sp.]MCL4712846.1 DUF2163 domain-containing protein [Pseudorhodoplanes sp.]GIK80849.1 MAG: hypothetical protein BroJett024_19540 [Alphaproteobacteria bacterium]